MKILIDADGCPVVDRAVRLGKKAGVPVILVCDDAHKLERPGAETVTVSQGADSADFALIGLLQPGDIAVTQDYGLAAMCLSKGAKAIHQDGFLYTEENIGSLLQARYQAKKIRRAGGRLKGPKKRTREQDICFEKAFSRLLGLEAEPSKNCHIDRVI